MYSVRKIDSSIRFCYFCSTQKAELIKEEAEELQIPEDNVTEPVSKANDKLRGYKEDAAGQKESIAKALKRTKTAAAAAKRARDKIKDVLEKLLVLLKEVQGLETVNASRINQLYEQFHNDTDDDVSRVVETSVIIRKKIRMFTINLKKLRAEKDVLQGRYEKLPTVCPRETPPPEGPGT